MSTTSTKTAARTSNRPATILTLLLLAAGTVMSPGCWPRQLVVWSPDGMTAVVMHANSTSLCDGDGKLTQMEIGVVSAAAWMPDSKSALLAVQKSAANWTELAAAIDEPTRQAAIAAAGDLEKAILAMPVGGELTDDDKGAIVKRVFEGRGSLLTAAMIHLRDVRPAALRKRLGEWWKEMDKLSVGYSQLRLFDRDGMSLRPAEVILNLLKGVHELRVSPDGRTVAFVAGSDRTENSFTLWVAPIAPGAAQRELADRVALFPAWSADGQHVAYVQATNRTDNKSLRLGTLARRRVIDANGAMPAEAPDAEELAGLIFADALIVRCLADGRILFSAAEVTLPTTTADMPKQMSLFAVDPASPATVTRMIPRQSEAQVPDRLLLELSPDQKRISIAGGNGQVAVMTLADGQTTWAQKAEGKLQALPSWRGPAELCFIIPATKDDPSSRAEVALWSAGKTRVISKTWPDEVLENLTFAHSPKKKTHNRPRHRAGEVRETMGQNRLVLPRRQHPHNPYWR